MSLRILGEIKAQKNLDNLKVSVFFKNLPKELQGMFSEIILLDLEEGEIDLLIKDLKLLKFRHSLEILSTKIAQAENSGDEKAIVKYQKTFAETAKKLSELEEAK